MGNVRVLHNEPANVDTHEMMLMMLCTVSAWHWVLALVVCWPWPHVTCVCLPIGFLLGCDCVSMLGGHHGVRCCSAAGN